MKCPRCGTDMKEEDFNKKNRTILWFCPLCEHTIYSKRGSSHGNKSPND